MSFKYLTFILLATLLSCQSGSRMVKKAAPNIIWICAEDMNDWMSCYGDNTVQTPHLDSLASKGLVFKRAYMTAGVCSASRSAIALGSMQTTFGVHNHRSSRQRIAGEEMTLPDSLRTVYQLFRDKGYQVVNMGPKNDFNFLWASKEKHEFKKLKKPGGHSAYPLKDEKDLLYDVNSNKWGYHEEAFENNPDNKPYFIQFQLKGGKNTGRYHNNRSKKNKDKVLLGKQEVFTDTAKIKVMPYYPELPSVKLEIAHHYDCIRQTDDDVGRIIKGLKRKGLLENSIIFFWSDHGMKLARHKQWLYEGGIRVPMIIAGNIQGKVDTENKLISGIDITVSSMKLAGIPVPEWMEGKNIFDEEDNREYVISARDRCDYSIDRVRSVTSKKYKYIRNFLTDRPFSQAQYRDKFGFMKDMKAYYESGKMNEVQSFQWKEKRVEEEFYDLENDPFEINNLFAKDEFQTELNKHRSILENWMKETDDKGQYPESDVQLRAVLKQWSAVAVNPEYTKLRNEKK